MKIEEKPDGFWFMFDGVACGPYRTSLSAEAGKIQITEARTAAFAALTCKEAKA